MNKVNVMSDKQQPEKDVFWSPWTIFFVFSIVAIAIIGVMLPGCAQRFSTCGDFEIGFVLFLLAAIPLAFIITIISSIARGSSKKKRDK